MRGTQTVGHRLARLQVGCKRCGLGIVEVEHNGVCPGDEAAKKAT